MANMDNNNYRCAKKLESGTSELGNSIKFTIPGTFLFSQAMIFALRFELGVIYQSICIRGHIGAGGLKALATELESKFRIVLHYKSLTIFVAGSNAPPKISINSGVGKHLWGLKYMRPDPIGECAM